MTSATATEKIARKGLADTRLYAPLSGVIGKRQLVAGETALPSQAVVNILDISTVKVKVAVPESEIGSVNPGTSTTIKVDAIGRSYRGGRIELDPEDDAAYVNWGSSWRMPTVEQLNELINNCSWTWTTCNGVYGSLFTGPNGNTLFLPAAGGRWGDRSENSNCVYWTRELGNTGAYYALGINFYSEGKQWWNFRRNNGLSVRAVRVQ